MVKTKNKKRNLAEYISDKKKAQNVKTLNPFEIHINKEKMRVLGQKLKNDRGLPGISRAKALKKRKGTLLQEYKLQHKSNKFIDKRIGERNVGLTEDDRAMARFAAVRTKEHKKKSIFNLADDEVLTHRGQTLNEIEKFDDPRSDDEGSEDGHAEGRLESDFVEDAHFGGGILSKKASDGFKSHKDLINQLIVESKKRKAEKQKTKEKTLELTEKLDNEWKDLIPLVNKSIKQVEEPKPKPEIDDYDKVLRELKFEARGQPSDRLKSEDEIAKEEKEKLEKLEKERLARMKGVFEKETVITTNHRSADDLDDDFVYEEDQEVMLSYNEKGESNVQLENGAADENVEVSEDEVSSEEVETDSEDNLSDLKEESSASEDENEEESGDEKEIIKEKIQQSDKIKADLLLRKEMMEKARQELPYTYNLPESYKELQEVLKNQPSEHQSVILERMIKCNHPSLDENNKEKLGTLFVYLLQYIDDISFNDDVTNCFKIFNSILPHMFELAHLNKDNAQHSLAEVIKEKQINYRKHKKIYPGLNILLFFKTISCLFPTSDFRHQVVTPSIIFIDQMLHKCKVRTNRDVAYGLFLTTLILEYTVLSKRYLPSAIGFLGGILHMAIPKSGIKLIKVLPPFKATSSILVLYKNCSSLNMSLKLESKDLQSSEVTEHFKIRVLYTTLKLILEFIEHFKGLSCNIEIFESILRYVELIPISNYPTKVQDILKTVSSSLNGAIKGRTLHYIVMKAKKPKALRLYEPNIQKVYDGKQHRVMSKEKAERAKMMYKLKKEKKGALREIRRDRMYLGRVQIKQKIHSDMERRDKVKRIFAEANIQQSELNAMDRKKKKKKF